MHDSRINRRKALEVAAMGGIATTVFALSSQPAAEAGEVPLAKVPAIVKEAASRIFPKARWSGAFKDKDDTGTTYDLEATLDNDIDVTVNVRATGHVVEVSKEIEVSQIPAKVLAAVAQMQPKFTVGDGAEVRRGENLQRADEGDVFYELGGEDALGRSATVEVTAEGKITEVQTEIPRKEVPRIVSEAVAARLPRFKLRAAYEVRQEGQITDYVLAGKRPRDKGEILIVVSADGKEIDIDDE